jgi:hypothetical protein
MLSETGYPVVFTLTTSLAGCGYHPVEAHAPIPKLTVIAVVAGGRPLTTIRTAVEEQADGR